MILSAAINAALGAAGAWSSRLSVNLIAALIAVAVAGTASGLLARRFQRSVWWSSPVWVIAGWLAQGIRPDWMLPALALLVALLVAPVAINPRQWMLLLPYGVTAIAVAAGSLPSSCLLLILAAPLSLRAWKELKSTTTGAESLLQDLTIVATGLALTGVLAHGITR